MRIDLGRRAQRARWRSSVNVGRRGSANPRAGRGRAVHGLGRERDGVQDLANLSRILDGGDQAQSSATPRAGENVNFERVLHQLGPRPMARRRLRGGILSIRILRRQGCDGHGTGGHHTGAPARIGSRYILLRERNTSPSTTAGTPSTARSPASIVACRLPTASCCFASCQTAREAPCPRG